MGYADGFSAPSADEEGFRASFIRKRHSLFGSRTAESTSSFDLNAPPVQPAAARAPVPGVLYHKTEQAATGNRNPTEAVDTRRRSFFAGRFGLGGKKEQLPRKRDSSPPKLEQPVRSQHLRGLSTPVDVSYISEDDCTSSHGQGVVKHGAYAFADYRNRTKSSISPPFNFQHVTHTKKKNLPALDTVNEKDLNKEFWAASSSQAPRRQLQGIEAEDLSSKPEAMGLIRGSDHARPTTPARATRAKPALSPVVDKTVRSSREDITALPGFSNQKRSTSRSKRDDFSSLLGLREKAKSSPTEATQESTKARADTYAALFGIRESSESKRSKDDIGSLLGFSALTTKQSLDSARPQRPSEESKRFSGAFRSGKHDQSLRRDVSSLLGFKERSMSESSLSSPKSKRDEVNALLGIREESTPKRHSKPRVDPKKQDEIDALLGIPKRKPKEFEPMAPPPPPRPRRSDEELKLRTHFVPSAPSPQLPPDRPRRDSKDVQYLREMGFGQLLYRENSNESRQGASLRREISNESRPNQTLHRQNSNSSKHGQPLRRELSNGARLGQPMLRQNSNESRNSPSTPTSHQYSPRVAESTRFPATDDAQYASAGTAEDFARAQQVQFRSRQPLPAIPRQSNITPEGRSPLQTVSEVGEAHPQLPIPTDPAVSPRSPNSLHSASRAVRAAELTGPSIPDDGAWENEIDFLYSKEAEATNDFDWDNISMTPQRLSVRDPDKRLSLNIPSDSAPGITHLSKKLSEGSLRSSIYMPAALNIQPHPGHRNYAPKQMSPVDEYASVGARASPEVRVMDVDDHRQDGVFPVGSLHMHGYESIAAGYLSDPESNSERSQHRKSNSYSSWESRPSIAKEPARYSNASISNVPELTFTRRPKQPITSIPGYTPQHQETHLMNPMNDYAAFSKGPYAQHQHDTTSTTEYISSRRPENISQSSLLRVAATRTAKDVQLDTNRWSRAAQNTPASPYPQEQHLGWI